jgi:hypothetical protein
VEPRPDWTGASAFPLLARALIGTIALAVSVVRSRQGHATVFAGRFVSRRPQPRCGLRIEAG